MNQSKIYPFPTFLHLESLQKRRLVKHVFADEIFDNELNILLNSATGLCRCSKPEDAELILKIHDAEKDCTALPEHEEAYSIVINEDSGKVTANTAKGMFYAIQTLKQLFDEDNTLPLLELVDAPQLALRGMHLYLPGRDELPFFKKWLEVLAELKYNTIFLEIGGGMEYKRHPEINIAWEQFAAKVKKAPNEYAFLDSLPYPKDSIHIDLGGGSFLTQQEVREIVECAKSLHLEIIPEVQALSHSYYLCMAYPEIAERKEDPFPDTCCPGDHRTFQLLFDVFEEVIEVFNPKTIHIGHDEVYSLGLCPLCKGKSGEKLFAEEVCRVHHFLSKRNIKVMMWSDKLMNIISGGIEYGGRRPYDNGENDFTYKCIDSIPKDIVLSNWYWEFDPNAFDYFKQHNFQTIIGNFHPSYFTGSEKILQHSNVKGAQVSAWCGCNEQVMAHNGVIQNVILAANAMWWKSYGDVHKSSTLEATRRIISRVRKKITPETASPSSTTCSLPLPDGSYKLPAALNGVSLPPNKKGLERETVIPVNRKTKNISFIHFTPDKKEFISSWLLPSPDCFLLGCYQVETEKNVYDIPIHLWRNILHSSVDPLYLPLIAAGGTGSSLLYYADLYSRGFDDDGKPFNLYSFTVSNPFPDEVIKNIKINSSSVVLSILLDNK